MVQFGGFLATQLNSEDYDNNLPPLEDLVQNFYVTQDAAFFLARPMFANKIQVWIRFDTHVIRIYKLWVSPYVIFACCVDFEILHKISFAILFFLNMANIFLFL